MNGESLATSLGLYDDDFATVVHRTLRTAHPRRSRSVSGLAAPAFAGAMMSRQVMGAIPVERRCSSPPSTSPGTLTWKGAPFAGAWRILALDTAEPEERLPDLAAHRAVTTWWDPIKKSHLERR